MFYRCTHADIDSRLFFKSGQNRRRISGRKSALYGYKKQLTHFGILGWNSWGDFRRIFCEGAPWALTYIPGFIQIRPRLGRYDRKPFHEPLSECNVGSSSLSISFLEIWLHYNAVLQYINNRQQELHPGYVAWTVKLEDCFANRYIMAW